VNPGTERDLEREIARSLVGALEVALTSGGSSTAVRQARDAAQVLELPGLDRLMSALGPHATRPWPPEIQPVVERLRRVCARATAGGGLAEFRQADADFHGLAAEIVAMEWSTLPSRGGEEGPSVPTLGAAEMMSDLSLAGEASAAVARRVRLTMPVAAAVRAAIDWLAGREGARTPIELRQDASALEIVCEMRDPAGVPPAHQVLSGVDGNLGPLLPLGGAGEGTWMIRVPSFSARPAYVMLMQGTLKLAVPWHAVLRIQVAPRDAIAARAARHGMTVLPRLSTLPARGGECPVVIVGHGLRRAWMVADRLVWRLPAEGCEPDSRLLEAGISRAVVTDEGEVFGLVEPRAMLASVALPALPRTPAGHAAPRADHVEVAAPLEHDAPEGAEAPALRETSETVEVLDELSVTPLPAAEPERAPEATPAPMPAPTEASAAPAPEPTPALPQAPDVAAAPRAARAEAAPPQSAPEPQPAGRRALLAEDSFTMRIFLTRLLEQHGFDVVGVERASELNATIARGPWSLVCVDTELPDARGAALLRSVREQLPEDTPIVSLARDEHDFAAARHAGVWRTLLKPVEPGALRRLLARLGLMERASG